MSFVITEGENCQPPHGMKRGLIPRDYNQCPIGYNARVFDLPLIPQAEVAGRLRDQIQSQSQLHHIRNTGLNGKPIPSGDQNGQGYCATADTEVLTPSGWVAYPEYNWSDPLATVNPVTHAMEFQTPFQRHVYEYDGPMIYSTNRRLDFGVTPDHELYVRKWDESRRTLSETYSFVRAGDLGWYAGFLHAPAGQIGTEFVELEIPGDRRYDGDDFIALLGLIVSDGYAGGSENTRNWVSFASFRPELKDAVAALAQRVGFHEQPSRPGVWIRYNAGALAAWLRENAYCGGMTGARAKCVPKVIQSASMRQIRLFLTWFDDRLRDGSQFYSTSKRLIDDLQELQLRIGKRSSIGRRPAKTTPFAGNISGEISGGECYVLTVGAAGQLCVDKKKHIETDHYKGLVYCAAVPNHTLLTRRNGSVLISSNCWAYSTGSALTLTRARQGEPYVELSPHAVAWVIKGGRDRGGWGSESLEFVAESGMPSSEFWPLRSMDGQRYNTDAMRENAKKHRVTEWMDIPPRSKSHLVTCLLLGIPVVSDFNWWGHSVCTMSILSLNPFRTLIWNSWGDRWGENGAGILEGNKAIPDGMICPRVAMGG